jgi:tetratricopeptide (TPR) repeat protein
MQLRHWRDTVALFEQARTATRRNHVAAAILANAAADEKQWDLANSLYAEALAYKERYADGHAGFAGALIRQGRSPEAGKHYQRALEIHPGRADARHGLALLLLQQNQAPEAVTEFRRALELDPNLSQAHAGLAIALQVLGRTDEANATYARVAGVSPGSAASYLSFGNFLITQGRAGEAIPCFQRVLELDPKSVDALGRLAWIHATHQNDALRNAGEALRLAQLACDLTGNRDALSVNTLAAAYAESGQFPKAIETAQKALDLANAYGQSRITMVIQNLLELYKSGKPYRE